jgi:putative phosphonate metabolism protein
MSDARYAIYFVPAAETPLYQAGAALIGYDVYSGNRLPFPGGLGFSDDDWSALTREPRVYGFHATLKAPFRLAPGKRAEDLTAQVAAFAVCGRLGVTITPAVRTIGSFAALVPDAPSLVLDRLAAESVRVFDEFRAPLSDGERAKRLAAPLTARHQENLERWGYPYVFEDFRFHMTLTGAVAPARQESVLAALRAKLGAIEGRPLAVDRIALVHQPYLDAPFRLVTSAQLAPR